MKFVITSTSGSENPTRASLAWLHAKGAVDAGHEASVLLFGDSVVVLREQVAENVHGVGLPPLTELMSFARENGITVHA